MQQIVNAKNLNKNAIIITAPKLNKNKQLSAAILNENTKTSFFIETMSLIAPFGITAYDAGKDMSSETKSWSITFKAQSHGNEFQDDINTLFTFLKDLDDFAIDYGLENSVQLFKKKYDGSQRAILADLLFNRGVKPSVGPDGTVYPDKITCKIMKNEQMLPDLLVFKDSQDPVDINGWDHLIELIPKGMAFKSIIQPKIYFVNGKFGINYRLVQIKIPNVQKVGRPLTYAFSDVNNTNESSSVINENLKNVKSEQSVYDSDGEEVNVEDA